MNVSTREKKLNQMSSKRFGFRQLREAAIERAKHFMEWTPKGAPEKEKMVGRSGARSDWVLTEVHQ